MVKKLTSDTDKLNLIGATSAWLQRRTESWEYRTLGAEIAYLLSAIAWNQVVELRPKSPLLRVLTHPEHTANGNCPPPKKVWAYIRKVKE